MKVPGGNQTGVHAVMRTAIACFAMALSIAPQMAVASAQHGLAGARIAEPPGTVTQTRFDLAPRFKAVDLEANGLSQAKFSPDSRANRLAEGARFGDGEIQYFEGPSWDYRTSRRGPMFEVAALGGGIEDAPYLAHVAMNWRF